MIITTPEEFNALSQREKCFRLLANPNIISHFERDGMQYFLHRMPDYFVECKGDGEGPVEINAYYCGPGLEKFLPDICSRIRENTESMPAFLPEPVGVE
jgi:hypothetical protein